MSQFIVPSFLIASGSGNFYQYKLMLL